MATEALQQLENIDSELLQAIPTGVDEIDHTHDEFIGLVNDLMVADDQRFVVGFDELMTHMELHIGLEDRLMLQSAYRGRSEHQSDHLRILGQLALFRRKVNQGRLGMARAFVRSELTGWFKTHVAMMDAALAAHLRDSA